MNWRRALFGILGACALVALFAYGLRPSHDPRDIGKSPLPGRAAPPFAMQLMGANDTVRLADLRGQIVVLNFWASWCLECRTEHAALQEIANTYTPKGVRFYGVLYNDNADNGRAYIDEMGGQVYPTLLDPRTRTAIDYGVYGVPETFYITPDGRVAYKTVGPTTVADMEAKLDSLMSRPGGKT
jgi:cytochrome c biogenesis protein CcmG/thiol:disulfide interchange protein DsbE